MWVQVRRAAASACVCALLIWVGTGGAQAAKAKQVAAALPPTPVTTLDGRSLQLPQELPAHATVLIIGFGRHSQEATTAWEKAVRLQLVRPPAIGFYDVAVIAEVPGFLRSFVIGRIRKAVPDVLKPNFFPLTEKEDEWKRFAGYTPDQPEAAYVVLVDGTGEARWSTHAAFTQAGFTQLTQAAQQLAVAKR